ncbi:MAG: ABC transporter permease [Prolixibacteraceae bacterium]|jgi:ABC-2 type transport system permease protein|nr:ABC transporter permease [Prolixibacteraceae bacterium]
MSPISLVIKREYLSRVKKKSFILFTLITPLIFLAFITVPTILMMNTESQDTRVGILNHAPELDGKLSSYDNIHFVYITQDVKEEYLKNKDLQNQYDAILEIPKDVLSVSEANITSYKLLSLDVSHSLSSKLSSILTDTKTRRVINKYGIPNIDKELAGARTSIDLKEEVISSDGKKKESMSGLASGIGYILGFLIYMFIFAYGGMVMQGVMEEKKNRVVEVIISSVKPFHLLLGKIIGIIGVGLTQLMIWLTIATATQLFLKYATLSGTLDLGGGMMGNILKAVQALDMWYIGSLFVFYFFGGVLIYSSLMAAVGAATDNPEDSQQFMLPLIAPLIISLIMITSVIQNPEGPIAVWGSIIPLSSPVIMAARLPFNVPVWQLVVSMVTLLLFFVFCVWIAAKVYSTGILMYGKKVSFKEIWKWIRHS